MTRLVLFAAYLCWLAVIRAQAADTPRTATAAWVVKGGRCGFIGADGRLLAAPRFAVCGRWSEGLLWVQELAAPAAPGTFIDARAQPIAPPRFRDRSTILPDFPWPAFDRGLAIVGVDDGGYGYVDRGGRVLGLLTPAGAFQRQDDHLLLMTRGGRTGFMDRSGQTVIAPRFAEATPFRGERAAARESERWGLIDPRGNWTAEPAYHELLWFADEPRFWIYRLDNKRGLIDRDGRRLIQADYDDFGMCRGNTVSFRSGMLWGLMTVEGTPIMAPDLAALHPFGKEPDLWSVQTTNGLWGVLGSRGEWRVEPRFHAVAAPATGLWLAQQSGEWGLLAPASGSWRSARRYQRVLTLPAPFEGLAAVEQRSCWGVVDVADGRERLAVQYSRIIPWNKWLAVQDGAAVRLIEKSGRLFKTWPGSLDGLPDPASLQTDLGIVRTAKGATLLMGECRMPWNHYFEDAGVWSEGMLAVKSTGKWGYVDRQGRWIIEPRFDAASAWVDGVGPVSVSGRWALVNREGKLMFAPAFDALGHAWNGLVPAAREGRWGLVNLRGHAVLPCEYDGIEWGTEPDGRPVYYGVDPYSIPTMKGYGR